ncbi:MAG: hypothetical protein E7493_06485 [Ruminococcus albus]|nr:hypothetical protein [Ruminococcus albus]
MRARKTLAIICYTVSAAACLAAGAVSLMAMREKISCAYGFWLFVPIWIGAFWFLTFFNALSREKRGKKVKYIVKKSVTKMLSALVNVLSILLLCFWVYLYIFKVMPAAADKNSDPLKNTAASISITEII